MGIIPCAATEVWPGARTTATTAPQMATAREVLGMGLVSLCVRFDRRRNCPSPVVSRTAPRVPTRPSKSGGAACPSAAEPSLQNALLARVRHAVDVSRATVTDAAFIKLAASRRHARRFVINRSSMRLHACPISFSRIRPAIGARDLSRSRNLGDARRQRH